VAHGIVTLFRRLTAGVYVIGVARGDQRNGFTAAWVTQVSFDPLLLALSVNPQHASYPLLTEGKLFSVNVLGRGQLDLARRFGTRSGRDGDKLAGVAWSAGPGGVPLLAQAVAHFVCRLDADFPAGDHRLVLGRVIAGTVVDEQAPPMSYAETGDLDGSGALYPATF
jgi:flavin reductase (DIM6/NTAB) family NADH-FMN oxidoreductase RutF